MGFDKNVTAEGLSKLLFAAQQLVPQLAHAAVTSTRREKPSVDLRPFRYHRNTPQ